MKWLTWAGVGVDRMACAWVIKRFIDSSPEFEFIPEGTKPLTSEAEPFDIPNVRLSHHHGHSSAHSIILEYKLNDPILDRIARLVDEADEVQEVSLEPAAPGLDLICRGLRRTSADDLVALERGYLIFEALYAELSGEHV